jgi:hypothetical protein
MLMSPIRIQNKEQINEEAGSRSATSIHFLRAKSRPQPWTKSFCKFHNAIKL